MRAGQRAVRNSCLFLAGLLLHGCYYTQAIRGQMEVMNKREPIAEVIGRDDTSEFVAARLALVQDARQFSIDELGLPDNKSYRTYADLGRDFVVWNVFAAPEFSLQAKKWCYLFVGCVAYRGYFREADAGKKASKLRSAGLDVYVGGVAAYSTLGHFSDPVLNTMMRWDDTQMLAVLFHELAHQVLFIKGDTGFNESFASAVEEVGVARFLKARGREEELLSYQNRVALQGRIAGLMAAARDDLESYYAQPIDDDTKRLRKARRFAQLAASIQSELQQSGRQSSAWSEASLNNARLLSFSLYDKRLPAFRALLKDCDGFLDCFYNEARRIAELDPTQRNAYLDTLANR
ncbi:MAG TPA: aminopeptidase [Woeseiaceae bacterium]|nr:aminopeptidase [Woeseiaceae bacterium]